jgi:hypothetical protein
MNDPAVEIKYTAYGSRSRAPTKQRRGEAMKTFLVSQAITDVTTERQRQRDAEGWTLDHDDRHTDGSIAQAAACYAAAGAGMRWVKYGPLPYWPFDSEWYKPKDDRRNLVRAAALCIAEIERLDRLTPNSGEAKS